MNTQIVGHANDVIILSRRKSIKPLAHKSSLSYSALGERRRNVKFQSCKLDPRVAAAHTINRSSQFKTRTRDANKKQDVVHIQHTTTTYII
jgi:hypothetical protein